MAHSAAHTGAAAAPRSKKHMSNMPVLPTIIFGPVEVARLLRELESVDEHLTQAAIRSKDKRVPDLPRLSRMLEQLAAENNMDLHAPDARRKLTRFLTTVQLKAPTIHISFATDPSAIFTTKIVTWLRDNLHPYTLLQLGLQSGIAAGCIVRTKNKTFDLSLRGRFAEQHDLLLKAIEGKL